MDLLKQVSQGMPASCSEMLRAAIPHALSTPKDERHTFQQSVIDVLSTLRQEEELRRQEVLKVSEEEVAKNLAANSDAKAEVDAAVDDAQAKREEKEAKAAGILSAKQAVIAAEAHREEEKAKGQELEAKAKAAGEAKQEFSQKADAAWEPLKAGTFGGRDWRIRNKSIDLVVEHLRQSEAPESLVASLPVVLKASRAPVEGQEERAAFATAAMEHADEALRSHAAKLGVGVEELEAAAVELAKSAEALEKDVLKAETERDVAMQAAIDSDNAWLEADIKVSELRKGIVSLTRQEGQLASRRDTASASLDSFRELATRFETLISELPAEDDTKQTEAAEEDDTKQTEAAEE